MTRPDGRFLLVQHHRFRNGFYDIVLDWVAVNLPGELWRFDLRELPLRWPRSGGHRLLVPWLQDPVEDWSVEAYAQALAVQAEADAHGIPVLNRVERLAGAAKHRAAEVFRACGLRAARMLPLSPHCTPADACRQLPLPIFIREDLGHGSRMLRIDHADEAAGVDLAEWRHPVAVELIDLKGPDGRYRKFRYLVAGEWGLPHHLQHTTDWISRGSDRIHDDAAREAELAYVGAPNPHHARFVAVARRLGLDFMAFDYGIDPAGQPVVWEVNPFPFLHFSRRRMTYLNPAYHRSVALMVALYYTSAGLPLPGRLAAWLSASGALRPAISAAAGADAPAFIRPLGREARPSDWVRTWRRGANAARRLAWRWIHRSPQ